LKILNTHKEQQRQTSGFKNGEYKTEDVCGKRDPRPYCPKGAKDGLPDFKLLHDGIKDLCSNEDQKASYSAKVTRLTSFHRSWG
jgi:hypothetical protein